MTRPTLALLGLLVLAACGEDFSHATLKVDLDAVVAEGHAVPVDGVTAAGQPGEAAFRAFAASGYTTVIDMRMPDEDRGLGEPALVTSLGMRYVPLPTDSDTITFEQARKLEALIAAADGPVLVHCASSNRVGALFALSEYERTGDLEQALEKGRKGGLTRLEGAVKQTIAAK